jgi:hypothetical protein
MKKLAILLLVVALAGCAKDYRYLEDTAAVDISDAPTLGTPAPEDKILTVNSGNTAGNRLSSMTFDEAPWLLATETAPDSTLFGGNEPSYFQTALTNPLVQADVDSEPTDGNTKPISSDWAYNFLNGIDPPVLHSETGTVITRNVETTLTDSTNIPDSAAVIDYGNANWLNSGTGLESLPTADDTFLKGTGADTYEWSTYAELKASLGVPVSGTDFYSKSSTDALITPTEIAGKIAGQPITPSSISVAPNSTGPQVIEFGEDTDAGQDKYSIGASPAMETPFGELGPVRPPQAGQIKRYNAPSPVTGADGTVRNMAQAYYEDPAAGNLVDMLDWPEGLTLGDINATLGADGNFQTQLDDLLAQIEAVPGLVKDTFPIYKDSEHVSGISWNSTTGALFDADTNQWYTWALTDSLSGDPGGPTALSFDISGSGPQFGTIVYDRDVTATTTADLCDDWAVELTNAGVLTLGYLGGDDTDTTVCTVAEDVYDDDTLVGISYAPGTIESSVGGVALAAIADFSANTTLNSSESPPISGCGTSSVVVDADFETNLDGFAQDSGNWGITSGDAYITATSGTARFLRSTTALSSDCQWVKFQITDDFNAATASVGALLRASGSTGNKYVGRITYGATNHTLSFMTYNGTTSLGLNADNITTIPKFGVGTVLMFQISGTGVGGTTLSVWIDPTGAKPSDSGAADYTVVSDQGTAVDSGIYAGLFVLDSAYPPTRFEYYQGGN